MLRDSAEAQRRKTACVTLTEFDQASELFERALKVDPDSLAARVNLGALKPTDRRFWVGLSQFWPRWRSTLRIVKPATVIVT